MTGLDGARRELAVAGALILALFAAVYGSHVLDGGWYADDWHFIASLELAGREGSSGLLATALDVIYRPVHAVELLVMWAIGRQGQAPYLAMGLLINAAACTVLYAVLRTARLGRLVAAAIVAVYAVAPHADATRLWFAAFAPATALVLLGLGLLGEARAAAGAHRLWRLSLPVGVALACLSYELIAPLAVLAVPVLRRAGAALPVALRAGALASATAIVVLLAQALTYGGERATTEVAALPDRLQQIAEAEVAVVRDTYPGGELLLGLPGLVAVVAAVVVLTVAGRRGAAPRSAAAPWLGLVAAGIAVIVLGLLLLAPADPYYVPRRTGIGNRVNVFSAIGEATAFVGLIGLLCAAIAQLVRRPRLAAPVTGVTIAGAVVALGLLELRQQDAWAASWRQSQSVVAAVRAAVGPDAPPGTSVVTFAHTQLLLPADVPVFVSQFDLDGAVELAYDDPTAQGHPVSPALRCDADAVRLRGPRPENTSTALGPMSYRALWFVAVRNRVARRVRTQPECEAALAAALAIRP